MKNAGTASSTAIWRVRSTSSVRARSRVPLSRAFLLWLGC